MLLNPGSGQLFRDKGGCQKLIETKSDRPSSGGEQRGSRLTRRTPARGHFGRPKIAGGWMHSDQSPVNNTNQPQENAPGPEGSLSWRDHDTDAARGCFSELEKHGDLVDQLPNDDTAGLGRAGAPAFDPSGHRDHG